MISVVIPVLNEEDNLKLLLPVLVSLETTVQIIVSDGGSRDGSRCVTDSFAGVEWVSGSRGRGAQLNRGASRARGDVLVFLHADTIPSPGAVEGVAELLQVHRAHFGAFRLRFNPPTWLPSTLAVMTAFASPWCCFGDQGIFCRADFFWVTGGFPETELLEDVHWVRRAGGRGRMVRSPRWVSTSSRRFQQVGGVRMSLRNLSILVRDLFGQDPARLAALYQKQV